MKIDATTGLNITTAALVAGYAYRAALRQDAAGRYTVRFPDLPEALTDGASKQEAMTEAKECLSAALLSRIHAGEALPKPRAPGARQFLVLPLPYAAMKVALYQNFSDSGLTLSKFARLLSVDRKEARRMLDPLARTKLDRLAEGLRVLGFETAVVIRPLSAA